MVWTKKSDYEFPKDFALDDWAWQFLRRNPDYRSEWEKILPLFREAVRTRDWRALVTLLGWVDKEIFRSWEMQDFGLRHPDSVSFLIPSKECKKKWGLLGYRNPDTNFPSLDELGFVGMARYRPGELLALADNRPQGKSSPRRMVSH